jgi:hypothetical protein
MLNFANMLKAPVTPLAEYMPPKQANKRPKFDPVATAKVGADKRHQTAVAKYKSITGKQFTSKDFADALKIDPTSASRICRRLVECGDAFIAGAVLAKTKKRYLYEWK